MSSKFLSLCICSHHFLHLLYFPSWTPLVNDVHCKIHFKCNSKELPISSTDFYIFICLFSTHMHSFSYILFSLNYFLFSFKLASYCTLPLPSAKLEAYWGHNLHFTYFYVLSQKQDFIELGSVFDKSYWI